MKIYATDLEGKQHILTATPGETLMEVITAAGLSLEAICGGCAACATCHVYIAPHWMERLLPKEEDEEDMLDMALDLRPNSRLSCQIALQPEHDGLEVTLAKS